MRRIRLAASAQADLVQILAWTQAEFGDGARLRYEALVATALRMLASDPQRPGSIDRPELGDGARSWHLRLSRAQAARGGPTVRRPRHFVIYRADGSWLLVGRVLHDAMELARHMAADTPWD